MERWKSHVRALLQLRDNKEKVPFVGVFTSLSQMEERFDCRQQILDDFQSKSSERCGADIERNTTLILQLQLRESGLLAEKLSQTVADLTAVLNLKEAELQYWQSRVSQYRQEALTLAKGTNNLKATLSEFEFTVECQAKELAALRVEQKRLKESLEQTWMEKERLLQRWMEEKSEEACRVNKYNDTQERWQYLTKQMKKHLKRETGKECVPTGTSSVRDATETSQSANQGIKDATYMHQEPSSGAKV